MKNSRFFGLYALILSAPYVSKETADVMVVVAIVLMIALMMMGD